MSPGNAPSNEPESEVESEDPQCNTIESTREHGDGCFLILRYLKSFIVECFIHTVPSRSVVPSQRRLL